MKTAVYQAALTCIASAMCPAFALAQEKPRIEALYDITLDIDDDGVVEIDEVVGGVGEEGMTLECAGPLRGGIRW